jgi:hypothetical protein
MRERVTFVWCPAAYQGRWNGSRLQSRRDANVIRPRRRRHRQPAMARLYFLPKSTVA